MSPSRKAFDDTTSKFWNWLATTLMKGFSAKFTDLGPFRAIKYNKLLALRWKIKPMVGLSKCN
jgi:hypothetical protein